MKKSVKTIIKRYALLKLKYDFMGYTFNDIHDLTYHHVILPANRFSNVEGRGCTTWNGAMLVRNAHDYLHVIESFDEDRFFDITSELVDIIIKGYLDMDNLRYIDAILNSFEKEYIGKRKDNGNLIIKEEFLNRYLRKPIIIKEEFLKRILKKPSD